MIPKRWFYGFSVFPAVFARSGPGVVGLVSFVGLRFAGARVACPYPEVSAKPTTPTKPTTPGPE